MEIVLFTLVAVGLYLGADKLLEHIEMSRGRRFEQRSLIFLSILLPSALVSFWLLRYLFGQ